MPSFQIHQQLIADCHVLGRLEHCHVLLNKNASVPWFILVPETTATDLLDIPAPQRDRIMNECAGLSAFIKNHFKCTKINFAAIGNIVPQLHLHVIGRKETDACWPKPVWGNLPAGNAYPDNDIEKIRRLLQQHHLNQGV